MDRNRLDALIRQSLQAQPGSAADYVQRNFPYAGETASMDISPRSGSPGIDSMLNLMTNTARRSNPAGMQAIEETAPVSENIEDRRGENVMDVIKRAMAEQDLRPPEFLEEDQTLPGLPVPSFK